MKKFSTISASMIALAAIVITGCDSNKKTASAGSNDKVMMGAMNDKCPISGGPVDKSVKYASFEGHSIGFCCNGCTAKWDAMSKADKEAWVAKCMHSAK